VHATCDGAGDPYAPNFGTKNKKSAPYIRYSFAHGVAQPLLQCSEEEQEQGSAKDHFDGQVEWFGRASLASRATPILMQY